MNVTRGGPDAMAVIISTVAQVYCIHDGKGQEYYNEVKFCLNSLVNNIIQCV